MGRFEVVAVAIGGHFDRNPPCIMLHEQGVWSVVIAWRLGFLGYMGTALD
jgi:hypothetical protein